MAKGAARRIPKLSDGRSGLARAMHGPPVGANSSGATVKAFIYSEGRLLLVHDVGDQFPGGKRSGLTLAGGGKENPEPRKAIEAEIQRLLSQGQDFGGVDIDAFLTRLVALNCQTVCTIVREVLEEAGVLIEVYPEPYAFKVSDVHSVLVYRAVKVYGQPMTSHFEGAETDWVGWIPLNALPWPERQQLRPGWSLYRMEAARLKVILKEYSEELKIAEWKEEEMHTEKGLGVEVRAGAETRFFSLNWTDGVIFGSRFLPCRDAHDVVIVGIGERQVFEANEVPDNVGCYARPVRVGAEGGQVSLSHTNNRRYFLVERRGERVAVIEFIAADMGGRRVTLHVFRDEDMESVGSEFRPMIESVLGGGQSRAREDGRPHSMQNGNNAAPLSSVTPPAEKIKPPFFTQRTLAIPMLDGQDAKEE